MFSIYEDVIFTFIILLSSCQILLLGYKYINMWKITLYVKRNLIFPQKVG